MPSIQAQYNQELIQAHREALSALRQLLAEEKNPIERRRLAVALLKARPVKDLAASSATTDEGAVALSEPDVSARQAGGSATASSDSAGAPSGTEPDSAGALSSTPRCATTTDAARDPVPPPSPDTSRDCTHPALPPFPGLILNLKTKGRTIQPFRI